MAIRKIKTNTGMMYCAYFKYQGKQITKRFQRRKDALEWEVEAKKLLRQQEGKPLSLMYSTLINDYIVDCDSRMQRNTVQEKKCHCKEFAQFMKEDFPVESVTIGIIKTFLATIYNAKGAKAANRRLRTMKACWNWQSDLLNENPWRLATPYPEDQIIKYVPKPGEVEAVLAQARGFEESLLIFLLSTGARVGEAFNLTWDDVHFERSTIALWTRKRKGGSRQSRLLPIPPRLLTILKDLEIETGGRGHVFINPLTSKPYHKLQPVVRHMLKRLCQKSEVNPFGFHALRHFVASRLMESNQANIVEIQQLLGHQRTTTTDTYLRSLSSGVAHLAGVIEDAVLPQSYLINKDTTENSDESKE